MSERDRIATAIASMNGTIREVAWNGVTDESHYAIDSIAAADAVLAVLPLPSAEVRKAMQDALSDLDYLRRMASFYLGYEVEPRPCVAVMETYLATMEDAE